MQVLKVIMSQRCLKNEKYGSTQMMKKPQTFCFLFFESLIQSLDLYSVLKSHLSSLEERRNVFYVNVSSQASTKFNITLKKFIKSGNLNALNQTARKSTSLSRISRNTLSLNTR